jgi:hypothetical protein
MPYGEQQPDGSVNIYDDNGNFMRNESWNTNQGIPTREQEAVNDYLRGQAQQKAYGDAQAAAQQVYLDRKLKGDTEAQAQEAAVRAAYLKLDEAKFAFSREQFGQQHGLDRDRFGLEQQEFGLKKRLSEAELHANPRNIFAAAYYAGGQPTDAGQFGGAFGFPGQQQGGIGGPSGGSAGGPPSGGVVPPPYEGYGWPSAGNAPVGWGEKEGNLSQIPAARQLGIVRLFRQNSAAEIKAGQGDAHIYAQDAQGNTWSVSEQELNAILNDPSIPRDRTSGGWNEEFMHSLVYNFGEVRDQNAPTIPQSTLDYWRTAYNYDPMNTGQGINREMGAAKPAAQPVQPGQPGPAGFPQPTGGFTGGSLGTQPVGPVGAPRTDSWSGSGDYMQNIPLYQQLASYGSSTQFPFQPGVPLPQPNQIPLSTRSNMGAFDKGLLYSAYSTAGLDEDLTDKSYLQSQKAFGGTAPPTRWG